MNTRLELVDFAAISPLLIVLGASLLILLIESFAEKFAKKLCFPLTALALIAAFYAALVAPSSESSLLTPWLTFDALGRFFTLFFLAIGLASTLLAASFFQRFETSQGEYFFLLLASVFGLILIGLSADFLTLFLGLETLSISLYVLCGYMKKWDFSHESAIKYFLIGAFATAFLLYGIALIYGAIGSTRFDKLLAGYQSLDASNGALFLTGIALVTIGFSFKAAIVPFHAWAPDVYDGAPTPVTAFMAVGTKVGAFAAFARVFLDALPAFDSVWSAGISLLAYATLIYANLVALRQTQMRRFFAYSGISNAGFLLIPLVVGTADALPPLLFYLVVYSFATLGSFAVLAFIDHHHEGVMLNDLNGLFYRSPFLAFIFTICLLTLAGIPPTVGFFAKFYVFKIAFEADYYGLVIIALLTTIISVFYYARIIATMFSGDTDEEKNFLYSWPAALVGVTACLFILILSFYSEPLLLLVNQI